MAGYHKTIIHKGALGETSKIQEELDELRDAESQGCKILALVELSDLVGAIKHYVRRHHPGFKWKDLIQMEKLTRKAFDDGSREGKCKKK